MRRRKPLPNPALDLFGEVPVTESDVIFWVECVAPRWLTPERSFRGYVSGYQVADKVRAAKLAGTFYSMESAREIAWNPRLALSAFL